MPSPAGEARDARRPAGGLHGRSRGKALREGQSDRLSRDLPGLTLDLAALAQAGLEPTFGRTYSRYVLEIGFGAGEHLAASAEKNEETGFLGAEAFVNGIARLLFAIEDRRLRNIRVHPGDARDLIAVLPDASLDEVVILYPDPWPKRRQRKRRIISDAMLTALARVLKPGGRLRFATDIDDYAGWTLARILRSPDFDWLATTADDWRRPWPDWPGTRYEAKAIREGRVPSYLTFRRR